MWLLMVGLWVAFVLYAHRMRMFSGSEMLLQRLHRPYKQLLMFGQVPLLRQWLACCRHGTSFLGAILTSFVPKNLYLGRGRCLPDRSSMHRRTKSVMQMCKLWQRSSCLLLKVAALKERINYGITPDRLCPIESIPAYITYFLSIHFMNPLFYETDKALPLS